MVSGSAKEDEMADSNHRSVPDSSEYDALVIGASLAGCTTAILLGRAGARVAVVEKQPDPAAFKRVCSHFIQASAAPTIERLDLMDRIEEAGGVRSRIRAWTRWGWIDPPPERAGYAVNLRREVLDPMIRETASGTPGVDVMLGRAVKGLLYDGDAVCGAEVGEPAGDVTSIRARLVIGADGRDSRVAQLADVPTKTLPHGRFAYGAYFEGAQPSHSPDGSMWMLDPQWAAAFPTDSGLTFYAVMLTKDRLAEFRRDPEESLVSFLADLPDAPPIATGRRVGPVLGKIEMPNRIRRAAVPGLALVGDAALATDPIFGVGCGWALQSGEWLADSVVPALLGQGSLERGLARYRRRHGRALRGHAFLIHDYATGRRLTRFERALFAAAARDPTVATRFDEFGTRRIGPARMLATALPRVIAVNARHALAGGRQGAGAPSTASA
jgi:2-polyprenyl-6-methoxyphenol hydroxylase-like FAD-dependent oxidoreductase